MVLAPLEEGQRGQRVDNGEMITREASANAALLPVSTPRLPGEAPGLR